MVRQAIRRGDSVCSLCGRPIFNQLSLAFTMDGLEASSILSRAASSLDRSRYWAVGLWDYDLGSNLTYLHIFPQNTALSCRPSTTIIGRKPDGVG